MITRRTIILLLATSAVFILLTVYSPFRIGVGFVAAVLLPGYALSVAIFAKAKIGSTYQITIALVLSGFLLQIGGILLNWARIPLTLDIWLIYIGGTTAVFLVIGILRRIPFPAAPAPTLHINLKSLGMFSIALLLTVFAYYIADTGESLFWNTGFTQLSAQVTSSSVQVTVTSFERQPQDYRLFIITNGRAIAEESFQIESGSTWYKEIPTRTINTILVELYLPTQPGEPYRRLRLQPEQ